MATNIDMITGLIPVPMDGKTCNYYIDGDYIVIESIHDYLERVSIRLRTPGTIITFLLSTSHPDTSYFDLNEFSTIVKEYSTKHYFFDTGVEDSDLIEFANRISDIHGQNTDTGTDKYRFVIDSGNTEMSLLATENKISIYNSNNQLSNIQANQGIFNSIVIGGSPIATQEYVLDTLQELHIHENKTILDLINQAKFDYWNAKEPAITKGTAAQYFKGNMSLGLFPTKLSEFTNDLGNYGGFLTEQYVHPTSHNPSIIAQNSLNRFVTDAQISVWNSKQSAGNYIVEGDTRLTDSRIASDVYSWAKAITKPSYTFSEIGSTPTSLAGYGILDSVVYTNDSRLSDSRNAADVYSWAKASTKPSYTTAEVTEQTNLYYTDVRVAANSAVVANSAKVSFPGFGTTNILAAYGDHLHGDTYLPLSVVDATGADSGFVNNGSITISYNWISRTITLNGDLRYLWRGIEKTLGVSWTSSAHNATNGNWYLYTIDGTTFSWSQSAWLFSDVQIAAVSYGGSADTTFAISELHGTMDWKTHEQFHQRFGTYVYSGGKLTAGTYLEATATDVANSPGFDAAVVKDEDCNTPLAAWTEGTYTTMYIGVGGAPVFNVGSSLPFIGSGYINVNDTATGNLAAGINNRFYNVYQILIPTTSDATSAKYRMIMLQPQATFTSADAAKGESVKSLNLGTLSALSAEFVIYSRITYATSAGYSNTGKCSIGSVTYELGDKASQQTVTGVNPSAHTSLSFLNWTASGHIGLANSLAGFNAQGIATEVLLNTLEPAISKSIGFLKWSGAAWAWDTNTYLTSQTSHADVLVDGDFTSQGIMLRGATSGVYSILTDNSANWNTAFGWGNHTSYGYLTSETDPTVPSWAKVSTKPSVSNWSNDSGYITSASLNGYATQTWVTNQGYQPAATAITTSNIGSQSVAYAGTAAFANDASYATTAGSTPYAAESSYASSAGNADTLDGYHASSFALAGGSTGSYIWNQIATPQAANMWIGGQLRFTASSYGTSYNTVLGTRPTADGVLQFGNNGANYIVAGNTAANGMLYFYVNATSDFITSTNGTLALTLANTGAATFASTLSATTITATGSGNTNSLVWSKSGGGVTGYTYSDSGGIGITNASTYTNGSLIYLFGNGINFYNGSYNFVSINSSGQLTSAVNTGTAPFTVASSTQVANLNASLLGDIGRAYYIGHVTDKYAPNGTSADDLGFYQAFEFSTTSGINGGLISFGGSTSYTTQIVGGYGSTTGDFRMRTRNGDAGTWNPWRSLYHTGNLVNPTTGTGTTNRLPKFTSASTIGDSLFYETAYDAGYAVGSYTATNSGYRTFNWGALSLMSRDAYDGYVANNAVYASGGWVNKYPGYKSLILDLSNGEFTILTGAGTTAGGGSDFTTRLRLDNSGYMDLTRGGKLLRINPNYNVANGYAFIGPESTASMGMSISSSDTHPEYFYINTSGNIGIGRTDQIHKVDVLCADDTVTAMRLRGNSSGSNNVQLRFGAHGTNTDFWAIGNAVATGDLTRNFDVYDLAAGYNRFRINSDGKTIFGHHVLSTAARFEIKSDTHNPNVTTLLVSNHASSFGHVQYDTATFVSGDVTTLRIVEYNNGTTTNQEMTFSMGDGYGRISTTQQPLQFFVNGNPQGLGYTGMGGTQAMDIHTNGYIGMGYTGVTDYKLKVNGDGYFNGNIVSSNQVIAGTGIGFRNAAYQYGLNPIWSFDNAESYGLAYYQANSDLLGYGSDGIGFHFGNTSTPPFFVLGDGRIRSTATTASSSTSTGALVVAGGVGIGGNIFTGGYVSIDSGSTYPLRINSTQRYKVGFYESGVSSWWLATDPTNFVIHYNGVGDKFTFGSNGVLTATGFSGYLSGNATTATTLQTARTINRTSFNGSANIEVTEWYHGSRDYPNGTLISTSIWYGSSEGAPFILEIKGNTYTRGIPVDIQLQAYIYADTLINVGGYSNGSNIGGLVAINVGGYLCFWFPYQGYWEGYNVRVYAAYGTNQNQVTAITHEGKPTSTKEVALTAAIQQSLRHDNFNAWANTATTNFATLSATNNISSPHFHAPNNGLISIGDDAATYTYNDGSTRSRVYINSQYPVLTLNATTNTNGDHGATIQFTGSSYDSYRHWVIGSGGTVQFLDFGTGQTATKNPHFGISGYTGNTIMRMTVAGYTGIGGNWGTYGKGDPSAILHVHSAVAASSHGKTMLVQSSNSAGGNYVPISFEAYGDHSWGTIARFYCSTGQDRPSIQFGAYAAGNTTWNVGFAYPDDNFHITMNNGVTTSSWGTTWLTLTTAGNMNLASTTASTSTSTGALVVAGGLGVGGAINVGGVIRLTSTSYFIADSTYGYRFNNYADNYNNFIIYDNGNIIARGSGTFTGGGFNSLRSLKDIHKDWKGSALNEIAKFKMRDFNYYTQPDYNRTLGFIIDEIPKSVQEYVLHGQDKSAINLYSLHALSFKAHQETKSRVELLEEKVKQLEQKVYELGGTC